MICFAMIGIGQPSYRLGNNKPKVGLALSGGSAHGFAHIGVIKYLEEIGIPIDYVTGTSMGSVVGGLKSMGYSSGKMRSVAAYQDWSTVMSNKIPYYEISPIEKNFHQRVPFRLHYKEGGFQLPAGFIKGQKLDLIISRIYGPAYNITDFDDLKTPFRCYAIDILNGDIVEMKNGYLGKAVRSSMAIPTVFTPVEHEDKLLVDGGVIRNFPVQNVIDMGSDYTIGVYVGRKPQERSDIKSVIDILTQTAFLYSIKDSEEQSALCDVLIEPDVKHINSFEFDRYDEFIQAGYLAAKAKRNDLLALKTKLLDREVSTKSNAMNLPTAFYIDNINLGDTREPFDNLIRQKFGFKPKRFLKLHQIEEGISKIYGTKLFDRVYYNFEKSEGERVGLNINTLSTKRTTVGINANYFKNSNTAVILSTSLHNVVSNLSRLNANIRLSAMPGIELDFIKRLNNKVNYIAGFSGKLDIVETPFYNRQGTIRRLYRTLYGESFLKGSWEPDNHLLATVGLGFEWRQMKPKVLQDIDLKKLGVYQFKGMLEGVYDRLDAEKFPSSGFRIFGQGQLSVGRSASIEYANDASQSIFRIDNPSSYSSLSIKGENALSLGSKLTLISKIGIGLNSRSTIVDDFIVGGTSQVKNKGFAFIGLDEAERILHEAFVFRQEVRIQPFSKIFFTGIINYLSGKNSISTIFNESSSDVNILGYGVSIGLDLPIGPLELDIGFSDSDDKMNTSFGIGYRHIY